MAIVKLIYKPFGIVLGILAGMAAKRLFERLWGVVDDREPPKPATEQASWGKVIAAAAIEGVTFKVTRAAVARIGAQGFRNFTGVWPGPRKPDAK